MGELGWVGKPARTRAVSLLESASLTHPDNGPTSPRRKSWWPEPEWRGLAGLQQSSWMLQQGLLAWLIKGGWVGMHGRLGPDPADRPASEQRSCLDGLVRRGPVCWQGEPGGPESERVRELDPPVRPGLGPPAPRHHNPAALPHPE